ncbi:MAG: hypothetical protein II070_02475 [Treponema sp.]|nr:hypothetical protein [Treponema sp.]
MEFLTTKGIAASIEKIIRTAREHIVIISPYIKVDKTYIERLHEADRNNVRIHIVFGKKDMADFEKDKFQNFRNLNIYFLENLHAKCYMNENSALITSMNLYGYSEENNREMGLFINRSDNYNLYDDMKGECLSIINSAKQYLLNNEENHSNFPLDDTDFPLNNSNPIIVDDEEEFLNKFLAEEFGDSEELEGHCIRCGTRIYLNENYPLCEDCYRVWAQYNNPNFQENYCHKCGQRITWQDGEPISYANPLCPKCSQEIHNWPM